MKKVLFLQTCILFTALFSVNVNAQRSINKNYCADGTCQLNSVSTNSSKLTSITSTGGYYFEGFEGTFPPTGWQIVDVLDTSYVWSTSATADYPAAYEGNTSAYMHYNFNGAPGGEDWLITPKFTVASGDSFSFQFKFEYMGYPPDSTFILISTTDSALTGFTDLIAFIADTVTAPGTVTPLWTYYSYSLNAYTGQDIYIAFKNKNIFGDGVFIDNVEIGTRPPAEVATKSIDMDTYYPTGTSNPTASVKNYGGSTQTFDVTMNITGGYTSTKSVTVPSQAAAQISFDPWNPTVGNYTINVQTLLTGDANPANDTLSASIKVLEPFVNYGWSVHDPLVAGTVGGAAASVCTNNNSRYFLMGGYTTALTTDAYEYDLSFATWAGISPIPNAAQYSAAAKANGKLYVFGGENATNIIGTTQIYDYTTDSWSIGTPMPTPMSTATYGTYNDSLVYILGGNIGGGTGSTVVQVYNTNTDSWTTATPKPGNPAYGCRGGIVNNKIVVAGGYDPVIGGRIGTTYVGVIDAVNPGQITWTQVDDHPAGITSRSGSAVSLDNNSGLVVFSGGVNSNTPAITPKTFAFDVNSNSWKLGPDKPTGLELFYMTPVIENDSIYLAALGGGDGANVSDKNEWLNLGYFQFTTGIPQNNTNKNFELFPNPATDATAISFYLKANSKVNIQIMDVMGKTVMNVCDREMSSGNTKLSMDTKHLVQGIYYCVLSVDGVRSTKKLIVK